MKVLYLICFFPFMLYAKTQVYSGEATSDGKFVYREIHTIDLDGGKVKTSETVYTDSQNKIIGRLKNDYEKSLSVPEHLMEDLLHKSKHGVRYKGNLPVMFNQEEDKEETKTIDPDAFKGKLLVGGQGLHYYIVENLEKILKDGKVDLKFLVPGRLDAYDFYLKVVKRDTERVEIEIEIDNWFLRLFAPKLRLIYGTKSKRLLHYSGLSNIRNEKKEIMNVKINYTYPD